jgi:hypothetical protein
VALGLRIPKGSIASDLDIWIIGLRMFALSDAEINDLTAPGLLEALGCESCCLIDLPAAA